MQEIFPAPFPLHFPNFRTCNGNSTGNVLCPDLKSDISFYASAGNLAFLPVLCLISPKRGFQQHIHITYTTIDEIGHVVGSLVASKSSEYHSTLYVVVGTA